jgi:hypothetical protein
MMPNECARRLNTERRRAAYRDEAERIARGRQYR